MESMTELEEWCENHYKWEIKEMRQENIESISHVELGVS